MTVESSSRKANFSGGQSVLTFNFRTLANHPEYIKVLVTSGSTSNLLTYLTDYTVSLDADGVGGTVTVSPTYSTAYTYTVYRETDDLQESDYDDFNQFPADTLEDDLDRRTLISQERSEDSDRTAKLPISYTGSDLTLPLPQDGYALVWSGGQLVNSNLTGATGSIGPTGPSGATGSISLVSSSTSDITVVSTGTTPIITAVNAATGGSNKILRLDASGKIPALDGSLLTALSVGKVFVGSTSRTINATSSNVSITGVGFQPKILVFFSCLDGKASWSNGIASSSSTQSIYVLANSATTTGSQNAVDVGDDPSNKSAATVGSFDSDGFTLAWTKTGSPTGSTAIVRYLAIG